MPRKFASMKNDRPSNANGRPSTSPNLPISPGQSSPISKLRTVPETAPIAKRTADTFDHRFARPRATASPRSPRRCTTKIIVGNATPKHASTMCHPSETAICSRAGRSPAGSAAAKRSMTTAAPVPLWSSGKRDPPRAQRLGGRTLGNRSREWSRPHPRDIRFSASRVANASLSACSPSQAPGGSRVTDATDFTSALAQAARTINQPRSMEETLQAITRTARENIPGFDEVGISLLHADGKVETMAATGELVWRLDRLQYDLRDGPCVSSLHEEPVIVVDHIAHSQRWPVFVPQAVKLGLKAQMALRLYVD